MTLAPFTGLGRPEQLLLCKEPSNWVSSHPVSSFFTSAWPLTFAVTQHAVGTLDVT